MAAWRPGSCGLRLKTRAHGSRAGDVGIAGGRSRLQSAEPLPGANDRRQRLHQFTNLPATPTRWSKTQPTAYLEAEQPDGRWQHLGHDTISGSPHAIYPGFVTGYEYNFGEVKPALISGFRVCRFKT